MRSAAFTLIELLIVILIISVLAALLLPVVVSARKAAYGTVTIARIESALKAASELDRGAGMAPLALQRKAGLEGVLEWRHAMLSGSGGSQRMVTVPATGTPLDFTEPHQFSLPWGRKPPGPPEAPASPRTLADLSPARSCALLQALEVVPAGADGVAAYRGDRGTDRQWNDRWGHPLLVAYGIYQPAYPPGPPTIAADDRLHEANQYYRYSRSVYLAIGAAGPRLRTAWDGDLTTDQATLWAQIREVCHASEWNETGFDQPPWDGIRKADHGNERCFLSAPSEIK